MWLKIKYGKRNKITLQLHRSNQLARTKGVELYGNHFKIIETDYPIVYKLIAYFFAKKDEPTCFQYGINLNKGILLTGPIGCGKTSLMNLMKYLTATEHKFFVKKTVSRHKL